ncbi:hypothetical protein KC346_g6369, partial [Hortaea werneckii]
MAFRKAFKFAHFVPLALLANAQSTTTETAEVEFVPTTTRTQTEYVPASSAPGSLSTSETTITVTDEVTNSEATSTVTRTISGFAGGETTVQSVDTLRSGTATVDVTDIEVTSTIYTTGNATRQATSSSTQPSGSVSISTIVMEPAATLYSDGNNSTGGGAGVASSSEPRTSSVFGEAPAGANVVSTVYLGTTTVNEANDVMGPDADSEPGTATTFASGTPPSGFVPVETTESGEETTTVVLATDTSSDVRYVQVMPATVTAMSSPDSTMPLSTAPASEISLPPSVVPPFANTSTTVLSVSESFISSAPFANSSVPVETITATFTPPVSENSTLTETFTVPAFNTTSEPSFETTSAPFLNSTSVPANTTA